MRHETQLNMLPSSQIRDWIFFAEPYLLIPRFSLEGLSSGFNFLNRPSELKSILENLEPNNLQLSIIRKIFEDKMIRNIKENEKQENLEEFIQDYEI